MKRLINQPPLLRRVYEAENDLRQRLSSSTASHDEMERIAVLTGLSERGEGSRDAPLGRWSRYYVRHLPSNYTRTRLEIYVPEGCGAIGTEFNPATHIAVPCDTSHQRPIQSGRIAKD